MNRTLAVSALALSLARGVTAQPSPYPPTDMPTSPIFPADNWWNVKVTNAPVDTGETTQFRAAVGTTRGMHPDFGGVDTDTPPNGIFGMVYFTVPGNQARVTVTFPDSDLDLESDHSWPGVGAGYPIPAGAISQGHWIEGGQAGNAGLNGDQHMLIVDKDNRLLYELWQANFTGGHWEAGSGAIFSLDSNFRRQEGWTSADAAGLAILPGLIRRDEATSGQPIRHAFRVTINNTRSAHVYPASHTACNAPCPASHLPMGARLRLRSDFPISGYPTYIQRIFQAMMDYGLIVADNGTDLFVQGAFDASWDNGVLNPAFGDIKAADLSVIQLGWQPAVPPPGGPYEFNSITPCRLLDTRNAASLLGGPKLTANVPRSIPSTGVCTIPPDAKAISVNVTTVAPPTTGNLRMYPGNFATAPNITTLNFRAGNTRANNAVITLATGGSGGATNNGTGTMALLSSITGLDVVIDVNGFFK